ncbi:BglG family transcription antiterminator [Paenibacillus sp. FA6]|uniref:BglG family transcription antiterminator n=1 Tax=Paenibacillus sp. FA6 TaxID=3413029 RepID=UPI003F65ACEE
MNVSSRTRQILELLLRRNRDLTTSEIAADIHVSSRTVHRELVAVEDVLRSRGIKLVRKSGTGIRLQGEAARLEELRRTISTSEDTDFSPDERQIYILILLLENNEPVKLFTLAHELKVTVPTIGSDLDELTRWVQKFGVTLIRRRGYGVELSGQEERLRETIRQLIKLRLDDAELISFHDDERPNHPLDRELFVISGKAEMADIEGILWNWEEHWAERLSENAYTDLLIRISIALRRIRAGKTVRAQYETKRMENRVSQDETGALGLTEMLSKHMGASLRPAETLYILGLLEYAQQEGMMLLPGDDLALAETVRSLILHIQQVMGVDFSEDLSLREGLFDHMKVAIQRLHDGLNIRNPLLDQIKRDYARLFGIVREATNSVLPELDVPNEEIGFLVMHFGASLERLKQLQRDVRAILVCTSGIGSSKLLQIRLQKELPQIYIVDRVSWYEASRISEETYDLIISTIDLPLDPWQYMKVSPLLTSGESERLRSFIREQTLDSLGAGVSIGKAKMTSQPAFVYLQSLNTTLNEIVRLIEHFKVVQIQEGSYELPEILEEACRFEEEEGFITSASTVTKQLLEREQSGSQMIPGTALALFHTRSPEVKQSSLSLYRLVGSLPVATVPPSRLSQFLLMLAPQTMSRESLEVLSEISAMLLDSEMIALLEAGDETAIRNYLTVNLKTFFNTKIERE